MRTIYGRTENNLVCDFVLDIPKNLIENQETFSQNNFDDREDVNYLD